MRKRNIDEVKWLMEIEAQPVARTCENTDTLQRVSRPADATTKTEFGCALYCTGAIDE